MLIINFKNVGSAKMDKEVKLEQSISLLMILFLTYCKGTYFRW